MMTSSLSKQWRAAVLGIAFAVLTPASFSAASAAPPLPATYSVEGIALGGMDAVSYFTGQPVPGSEKFQLEWKGAKWRFASAEAREKFMASPEAFAPRFGGYCAWAVSQGYIAVGDPAQWKVVDGKLYLNFNARAKELWEADQEESIKRGNANWPAVLVKNQDSNG